MWWRENEAEVGLSSRHKRHVYADAKGTTNLQAPVWLTDDMQTHGYTYADAKGTTNAKSHSEWWYANAREHRCGRERNYQPSSLTLTDDTQMHGNTYKLEHTLCICFEGIARHERNDEGGNTA